MRKSYFHSANLDLTYDEDQKTAYAVWNGFLSTQEFREAVTKCVELMEEKGIVRWLADNRKMKVMRKADQIWFQEQIIPRILRSSVRRMATLVSEDFFNKLAVEQLMQRVGSLGHLAMHDFEDEASAMTWLMAPHSENAINQDKG
ncbi:STAS/SEC14 domain-containing protein [Sabulibacter ruber]|uniref:STAS/SEC14 domain-containing protein n=1 Tax=Sabulibacter ruber TaxID=2811901 RepID=UPI001A961BDE|nr:STAS/SEC14 domain-containing protein [Sabulibacter ruber]